MSCTIPPLLSSAFIALSSLANKCVYFVSAVPLHFIKASNGPLASTLPPGKTIAALPLCGCFYPTVCKGLRVKPCFAFSHACVIWPLPLSIHDWLLTLCTNPVVDSALPSVAMASLTNFHLLRQAILQPCSYTYTHCFCTLKTLQYERQTIPRSAVSHSMPDGGQMSAGRRLAACMAHLHEAALPA